MFFGKTFMILVPGQNILRFQQLKAESFANNAWGFDLPVGKKNKKEIDTLLQKKSVVSPQIPRRKNPFFTGSI